MVSVVAVTVSVVADSVIASVEVLFGMTVVTVVVMHSNPNPVTAPEVDDEVVVLEDCEVAVVGVELSVVDDVVELFDVEVLLVCVVGASTMTVPCMLLWKKQW